MDGMHHQHQRKRIYQKGEEFPHPDKFRRVYDHFIYVVVIVAPIMSLPQVFKIWYYKNASGVSAISWAGFAVIGVAWLIYGILHKEKPIIIMNSLLIVMQITVALGAFLYG